MEVKELREKASKLPVVLHPNIVLAPHPIIGSFNREILFEAFRVGESLGLYLERLKLTPPVEEDFLIFYNDRKVTLAECETVYPIFNDIITIKANLHGGGDGDNKVANTLLTVAVIAASSTGVGGFAAGLLGGIPVHAANAILTIAGMALVNALVPIKPYVDEQEAESPTYGLSGSANRSRAHQPMPLAFGVVRMYPDHGAVPYTDYIGTDQYLTQVFNFGLTDIAYSNFKIGETDLTDYDVVEVDDLEISSGETGEITLFPTNVQTIAGGDLIGTPPAMTELDTFITRATTSNNSVELKVEISGVNYWRTRKGRYHEARVQLIIEYRLQSGGAWLPFFPAPGLNQVDLTAESTAVKHWTFTKAVTEGAYEVRVKLLPGAQILTFDYDPDDESGNVSGIFNEYGEFVPDPPTKIITEIGVNGGDMVQRLQFVQLKTHSFDADVDYTGQRRVALKVRATGQLNGRIDAFNAIVSSTIEHWNGTIWNSQVSSNPAYIFRHIALGKFNGTRRVYGAGLSPSRIDEEEIKLWGAWCTAKGLTCNIVFDSKISVIDMLNTVARCGRAAATWSSGMLGIVYDEAGKSPVTVFGMSNIVRDSFEVNYISENTADEIVVQFNNIALGYKRDTVSATVPDAIDPVNSVTFELKGIVDEVQAGREANLIAAEQTFRRRTVNFESDVEGLVVKRGDVAILSHDLTSWGYSGRLLAGTTTILTLDKEVPFTAATQHYISIRYPNGTTETKNVNLQTGNQSVITLSSPLSSSPNNDGNNDPLDYMWVFDVKATPGKKIKITDVSPLSTDRVRITATDEDDAYYLAESDSYTYVAPGSFLGTVAQISNLQLSETLVYVDGNFQSQVEVSWNVLGQYGGAFIEIKGDLDEGFKPLAQVLDRRHSFIWPSGRTITVKVIAYNLNFAIVASLGTAEKTIHLFGQVEPPSAVTDIDTGSVDKGVVNLHWSPVSDLDIGHYEIVASTVNNRSNAFLAGTTQGGDTNIENTFNHATSIPLFYWVRAVDIGGNKGDYFPTSSTGGELGTPDGNTAVADWESITGKPYDSQIVNTISFRHDFEDEEFGEWNIQAGSNVVKATPSYTGDQAGLFTNTNVNANWTQVPRISTGDKIASNFAGSRVRIHMFARTPDTNGSGKFRVAISYNDNSARTWSPVFNTSTTYQTFSFLVDIPPANANPITITNLIAIDGNPDNTGVGDLNGTLVDFISIDIVDDVADLAGEFGDLAGTDNLHNTYYGTATDFGGSNGPTIGSDDGEASLGDYWYDSTDDGEGNPTNVLRQVQEPFPAFFNWVVIRDQKIIDAIAAAADSQAAADGRIATFFNHQTNDGIPTSINVGDIWYDEQNSDARYSAAVAGASSIALGQWESAAGHFVDWKKNFGFNIPADNADVTKSQLSGSGANIANSLYTVFEDDAVPMSNAANGVASISTQQSLSGFSSLKLVATSSDAHIYLGKNSTDYNIPLTPNKKWLVSVSADKVAGSGSATIDLFIKTSDGSHTGSGPITVPNPNQWERLSKVIDLTANNSTSCILRLDNNVSGHTVHYDQLMIEEYLGDGTVETPSAYTVPGTVVGVGLTYGNVKTFFQNTVPTSKNIGDIWYDADDLSGNPAGSQKNKPYYAFSIGANTIAAGQWVAAPQAYANWTGIFDDDGKKPTDNADVSTTMKIAGKNNFRAFNTSDGGAIFFGGYSSAGVASDVSPVVVVNGVQTTLTKDYVEPEIICEGYLLWTTDGTLYDGRRYVVGIPKPAGGLTWDLWYNGSIHSDVTVDDELLAIGTANFNTATNTKYSTLWGYGVHAADVVGYNADITNYSDYRVSNSTKQDSVLTIANPAITGGDGASYSGGSSETGGIVVRMPQGFTGARVKFQVDVWTTDFAFTLQIGGYLKGNGGSGADYWDEIFAQIIGNTSGSNVVRFLNEKTGSKRAVIAIGDNTTVWKNAKIHVHTFRMAGGTKTSFTDWDDGWYINIENQYTNNDANDPPGFADALLDSANILNQGVFATQNVLGLTDTSIVTFFNNIANNWEDVHSFTINPTRNNEFEVAMAGVASFITGAGIQSTLRVRLRRFGVTILEKEVGESSNNFVVYFPFNFSVTEPASTGSKTYTMQVSTSNTVGGAHSIKHAEIKSSFDTI